MPPRIYINEVSLNCAQLYLKSEFSAKWISVATKIFKDCKFFKYLRRYEDFQRKMKNFCSKNFPLGSNLNNFSIFQTNLSKILFNFKIFEASKILQLLKMNQRWRRRWIFRQKSSKLRCNTVTIPSVMTLRLSPN